MTATQIPVSDHDQPTDRVVLVTGGSQGIGAGVAATFARLGAAVVIAARTADRLEAVAAEIRAAGGRALAVPTDVTDDDAVRRLVERTVAEYGRLDVAVNNATDGPLPPATAATTSATTSATSAATTAATTGRDRSRCGQTG